MKKIKLVSLLSLALIGLINFNSIAFSDDYPLPVFLHFLEYEEVEPYEIVIHYEGEFTTAEQKTIEMLEETEKNERSNITLSWRDHSEREDSEKASEKLPRIQLRYPEMSGQRRLIWEGPLEIETVNNILVSPLREKIAERLVEPSKAGVWILLKSGNKEEDDRVRKMVEDELSSLEDKLQVPDLVQEYKNDDQEFDINFDLFTLDRENSEERMLIKMLMGLEADLKEYAHQPILFTLYGKGFVMPALIGAGINQRNLASTAEFLMEPCTICLEEGMPPRINILLTAD